MVLFPDKQSHLEDLLLAITLVMFQGLLKLNLMVEVNKFMVDLDAYHFTYAGFISLNTKGLITNNSFFIFVNMLLKLCLKRFNINSPIYKIYEYISKDVLDHRI